MHWKIIFINMKELWSVHFSGLSTSPVDNFSCYIVCPFSFKVHITLLYGTSSNASFPMVAQSPDYVYYIWHSQMQIPYAVVYIHINHTGCQKGI